MQTELQIQSEVSFHRGKHVVKHYWKLGMSWELFLIDFEGFCVKFRTFINFVQREFFFLYFVPFPVTPNSICEDTHCPLYTETFGFFWYNFCAALAGAEPPPEGEAHKVLHRNLFSRPDSVVGEHPWAPGFGVQETPGGSRRTWLMDSLSPAFRTYLFF